MYSFKKILEINPGLVKGVNGSFNEHVFMYGNIQETLKVLNSNTTTYDVT